MEAQTRKSLADLRFLLSELEQELLRKKPKRKKARASHKKVPKPSALSFDEFKLKKEAQARVQRANAEQQISKN